MMRTLLVEVVVDIDPDDEITDQDLIDGLRARLDEFYPTNDGFPCVPLDVRVTVGE